MDGVACEAAAAAVSCSVSASQRRCDRLRVLDALDQHVDAVAAPEQFAIEHHGGYTEHAEVFGFVNDAVMLRACRAVDVSFEILCGATDGGDHAGNVRQFVDFEVVTPETPEHRVMVRPEQPMASREQPAGTGIEGIVNAPRPHQGEPL